MTRATKLSKAARLTAVLVMTVGMTALASPAEACAASSISLRDFAPPGNPPFYYTPEGADGTFVVGGAIDPGTVSVSYDTPPGSPLPATAGSDYARISGSFPFHNPGTQTDCLAVGPRDIDVPVTNDSQVDAAGVEELLVDIDVQNAASGVSLAPMYILDDEGSIRARLPEPPQASKSEPFSGSPVPVKIPVLRGGSGGGSITWSASPTSDLSGATSGTVSFTGGLGLVTVNIAHDTVDEPNETVTVTFQGTGGASMEGDSTFALTILDNDSGGGGGDTIAPNAWFHHPKHRARCVQGSLNCADTIHLFAAERPTHDPDRLANGRLALRKKLTNGNCQWWSAGSWRGGPCASIQWLSPTEFIALYTNAKSLYTYTQYPSLRPSVGTSIRNYTVYGRAQDVDGNWSPLRVGDSKNRFEVTRR